MDLRADAELATRTVAPQPLYRQSLAISAVLFCVFIALSFVLDPNAYLSTDVGGKTASLEAMTERGDWDLDMGYWFEESDPDGTLYPFAHTHHTPNGQWVNTTSYTMVYPARLLWSVGGARAALLLPILGAVLTAVAARALERRLSPGSDGAWSQWLVGLASPVAIYALDFWEHSLGLAAMAFGVVAVFDTVNGSERAVRSAALAGLAFGLAATMRQEALVYGFVNGLVVLVVVARRRSPLAALSAGGAMAAVALSVLTAYTVVNQMLVGDLGRLSRGAATAASASDDGFEARLSAAGATILYVLNGDHPMSYMLGFVLLVALMWLTMSALRGQTSELPRMFALAMGILIALLLLVLGPRFVPGMIPTTPLAAVGLAAAIHHRRWLPLACGLLPVPLLLSVQFPQGALPQWGGRYLLLTGLVLMVTGIALVREQHPRLIGGVAVGALAITIFGTTWSYIRMDEITDDWDALNAVTEENEVVVWRDFVKAREAGPLMIGERWLGAAWQDDQELAAELMAEQGIDQFIWIDEADGDLEEFPGYEMGEVLGEMDFFGQRMTRFVLAE